MYNYIVECCRVPFVSRGPKSQWKNVAGPGLEPAAPWLAVRLVPDCDRTPIQIFWQKFYRNVPGVVLYQPYEFCQNHWFRLVAVATERLKFRKKKNIQKTFFSEAIRGMKLQLCITIHDISRYINCIFIVVDHAFSLLWQLSFHIHVLIMGKVEIGIFFSVLLQIFEQKFYWNVSWVVLNHSYEFCPNRWIWLVAMAM